MRVVLWIVVLGAAAVALAWWLSGLPGTVSVSLAGWTVETSTALAIVGVAVIVVVLVALLRLLGWIVSTPGRMGEWRGRSRRAAGETASTRTLVALAAGDAGDARREAHRARRLLGDTPGTLLLAANAERLSGDEAQAASLFRLLAARDDAALLGLRGLFRQAMAREDWAEASAIAEQAEAAHPDGAWLRLERERLAARTGDWAKALRLAGPDSPRAAYAVAAAEQETDSAAAIKLARRAWRDHPDFTPAALAYARRLRAEGREDRVAEVLRTAWTNAPQPELAAMALDRLLDPLQRVRTATRLVGGRPEHPESHLLMARVNLDAGFAGEARRHLEAARAQGMNERRLWVLAADVEATDVQAIGRGDNEPRQIAQREALRHAALGVPDAQWRCDACGTALPNWEPVCPHCHTAGRVAWGPSTRLALPSG